MDAAQVDVGGDRPCLEDSEELLGLSCEHHDRPDEIECMVADGRGPSLARVTFF